MRPYTINPEIWANEKPAGLKALISVIPTLSPHLGRYLLVLTPLPPHPPAPAPTDLQQDGGSQGRHPRKMAQQSERA